MRIVVFLALLTLAASGITKPASALVGPSRSAPDLETHFVMVLRRNGVRASFCSASVVAQNAVLTAAHCVAGGGELRIHFRDREGRPVLLPVAAVAVHPGYRADAIRTRQPSIDLALVRLRNPLPATFVPISLASGVPALGETLRMVGFGVTQEDVPSSSGHLRAGTVVVRSPLSHILLWASDPAGTGVGACTGNSGGAILAKGEPRLIAVLDWAEGRAGTACGKLTQAALIAPQRAWVERILAAWRSK